MRLLYWLNLVGFISLLAAFGLFRNFYGAKLYRDTSCQMDEKLASARPHPFLCGQKININLASVADISSIDGISHKGALTIHSYLKEHPKASLKELIEVKGVGPHTLSRLGEHFF